MPISSPQPLTSWEDVDNIVQVLMAENGSVLGLNITVEIVENTGNTIINTLPVTVLDNGSPTTPAKLEFRFAPDLLSLVPGGGYKYYVRVNNVGGRDVLAWGAINDRNRVD